jgi:hypothetical protein
MFHVATVMVANPRRTRLPASGILPPFEASSYRSEHRPPPDGRQCRADTAGRHRTTRGWQ